MFRTLNGKGVSTALATIAIILVLVMSLTWMAYTVVLNARQQAKAAERAESIALKAKELIRVYVWLDPAQQTNGQYLNLTRISFVGSWSGETTINGLLVVYRDGSSRMLGLNVRLGAGEEKTYLPSELGIMGLDNYDAFRRAVKYIQAHTSLGNDFVSLWGRPDKPAIYIVTTTNTGTTTTATTPPTTTTTTTSPPPTTTTTTTTTPPTTTTTTGPTTSTVTSTVTRTVTSTLTSTSTAYYSTRCTVTTWVGALSTVTRTVTSTVTYWGTYTSTITHTTTVTSTSTSTTWVTSTVTSTATSVSTVRTTATSTYWVTTTRTLTEYTTVWRSTTVTYLQDSWYQGPSLDQSESCWMRVTVVSAPASVHSGGGVSEKARQGGYFPELSLAVLGLVAYREAGRLRWLRKVSLVVLTPYGLAVLLLVAVFMVGPVMEAAAQTATTTVTTTVTSTSYVTSTATTTQTVCTATTTVTSTTTGTITETSTVYVTTTTGPTTYVTSTVTVTSTAYTTRTSTYYTTTYTTTTVTWTSTWSTTTITSTTTRYDYTTSTITSTITSKKTCTRCGPFCGGSSQSCDCVYEGSYPC
jgi:hypothetical protein